MENLEFKAIGDNLTDKDIADFQSQFGIVLPEDFVLHYLKYNGGWPNADRSEGDELDYPFEYFLSIKYGNNTIEKKMEELSNNGIDCTERIAFAINDLDNTFHLCTDKENYGNVYVYDSGWEYHCESFGDFINGLQQSKFWAKTFDPVSQLWIDDKNHIFNN